MEEAETLIASHKAEAIQRDTDRTRAIELAPILKNIHRAFSRSRKPNNNR